MRFVRFLSKPLRGLKDFTLVAALALAVVTVLLWSGGSSLTIRAHGTFDSPPPTQHLVYLPVAVKGYGGFSLNFRVLLPVMLSNFYSPVSALATTE